MDAKVTKNDSFERIIEVDVPEEELTPHFDQAYRKYQKRLKLEGFRKGKVPLSMIKRLYGDAIKSETIDDVVQSVFKDVRRKEGLRPVAPARLEDVDYNPESGLHFKAVVEVVPDIEIKSYKGLSVEKEIYQVDDQDVAQALEEYRERMATMEPVEGEAEAGHFIVADFQMIDESGLPIIGKKFENQLIELRADEPRDKLTPQLLGVKTGDKRRIELENTGEEGGPAGVDIYEVEVKEIKSKQLPELDDELAKDVGEFETLAELKEDIHRKLERRAEAEARNGLHHRLIDELLKKNQFDLPESMISNYLDTIVENARNDTRHQMDDATLREQFRPSAIWNIKWELVKDKLQELEDIKVTQEDKDRTIARIAQEREIDEREVRKSIKQRQSRARFEDDVLEEKILDFLKQHAKIKDRKLTRKDLEKRRKVSM